jgi:hypothetical protein
MYPLPPQSVQQPGLGSGFGSGARSGAVAAYATETAAEALGASWSIAAGSAASHVSQAITAFHMRHQPFPWSSTLCPFSSTLACTT